MLGDNFYIDAFRMLSTERQIGMELGEVPWSKIVEYGRYKGLDGDMIDVLVHVVREMDSAYLGWTGEEIRKKARQGTTEPKEGAGTKR